MNCNIQAVTFPGNYRIPKKQNTQKQNAMENQNYLGEPIVDLETIKSIVAHGQELNEKIVLNTAKQVHHALKSINAKGLAWWKKQTTMSAFPKYILQTILTHGYMIEESVY